MPDSLPPDAPSVSPEFQLEAPVVERPGPIRDQHLPADRCCACGARDVGKVCYLSGDARLKLCEDCTPALREGDFEWLAKRQRGWAEWWVTRCRVTPNGGDPKTWPYTDLCLLPAGHAEPEHRYPLQDGRFYVWPR